MKNGNFNFSKNVDFFVFQQELSVLAALRTRSAESSDNQRVSRVSVGRPFTRILHSGHGLVNFLDYLFPSPDPLKQTRSLK